MILLRGFRGPINFLEFKADLSLSTELQASLWLLGSWCSVSCNRGTGLRRSSQHHDCKSELIVWSVFVVWTHRWLICCLVSSEPFLFPWTTKFPPFCQLGVWRSAILYFKTSSTGDENGAHTKLAHVYYVSPVWKNKQAVAILIPSFHTLRLERLVL